MTAGYVPLEVPPRIRRLAARVPTRLGRELVEQVLVRYAAGDTRSEIALELHVAPVTIDLWVRQAGLPRHGKQPRRMGDEDLERTVQAVQACGSVRAAARLLGRDERAIRARLRRHAPDLLPSTGSSAGPKAGDPQLDVEPLAQLLDERVKAGAVIERLAERAGVPTRRINAIRNREYSTVRLSTADRLCVAAGTMLSLVYLEEQAPAVAAAA